MKKTALRLIWWMILLFAVITYLSGCVTTKPNIPFSGEYPEPFRQLADRNPLLAKEIGKLPEIQDGISKAETIALEQLIQIYKENTEAFNVAFKEMYKVGLPEVRRYCSPLQAVYWLLLEGEKTELEKIITLYSLNDLLDAAWFSNRYDDMRKETQFILSKLDEITNQKVKSLIEDYISNDLNGDLYFYLNSLIKKYPNAFPASIWEYKNKKANSSLFRQGRWNDFKTVVDRLNSPELFNYWVNESFTFGLPIVGYTKTATKTFKDRSGDCSDICELGKKILDRAGYTITKICTINHVMGYTKKDGLYWVVIDYQTWGNTMHSPSDALPYGLIQCGTGVTP